MSNLYNSPRVQIKYYQRAGTSAPNNPHGFDVEFEVQWRHGLGHDQFKDELIALLDALHTTHAKFINAGAVS